MSQIMLYKLGSMITCGPHSLDYIIVDEGGVDEYLDKGWVKHPDDTVLPEPEPEPEPAAKKKPGPKPKAADDGENKG
ncbi:hypothetical protein EGT71_19635 [Atlantibacter subterranea]|uniref:Uncharacterized protein n=1 Tax=Atlantibacter subterraneus TaxID=255519 RepID=A0A427UR33_9ENTR|nr:hypothetical protein [Atlantibacter subterranea]RSB60336.1 hypothetical protein EGK67_18075 [Atlantibacter subterranea]RSE02478.1 hypothetical protein EGT84_19070 [Atlantibacter subterranea]RSE22989.1 hypothetical protein EGT71_19635 [Atlantibacter subterranea]